jgi:hypothetical protein
VPRSVDDWTVVDAMRADDLVDNAEAEIQVSPVACPRGAQSAVSNTLEVGNWRLTESVVRFVSLPKLDVVGSSPVARSWYAIERGENAKADPFSGVGLCAIRRDE